MFHVLLVLIFFICQKTFPPTLQFIAMSLLRMQSYYNMFFSHIHTRSAFQFLDEAVFFFLQRCLKGWFRSHLFVGADCVEVKGVVQEFCSTFTCNSNSCTFFYPLYVLKIDLWRQLATLSCKGDFWLGCLRTTIWSYIKQCFLEYRQRT